MTSETVYVILAVLCSVKAKKQRKKNKTDLIHWLHKNWVCDVMVCQSYSVYLTFVQKKKKELHASVAQHHLPNPCCNMREKVKRIYCMYNMLRFSGVIKDP